jgi:5-(aminomethyl)-3-furanmethanol phosphate kinase
MWVVKIGGSLNTDPLLPEWLDLLVQLGGGRVTLVCGGGAFADEVRRAQAHWRFDDLAAHNMAVLAMAQSAYMAWGLNPKLQLATSEAEIRKVLHGGHTALWLPSEWLRSQPDRDANWDNSADSIALDLARSLNAERMVVVKSCAIEPSVGLQRAPRAGQWPDPPPEGVKELGSGPSFLEGLADAGVLDRRFIGLAQGAAFPIDVIQRAELARMRVLLLGETRANAS